MYLNKMLQHISSKDSQRNLTQLPASLSNINRNLILLPIGSGNKQEKTEEPMQFNQQMQELVFEIHENKGASTRIGNG